MNILQNTPLGQYSTMGLGGIARYSAEIHNRMELLQALSWAQDQKIPVIMVGTGSNIVWRDEGFAGLLLVNKIEQYDIFDEDESNFYLTVGAGENWDVVVARTVAVGLTGIEALSLIPGTAGATPIQNVGAYGQEISQTLVTIEAFDTQARDFVTLRGDDCNFGYRSSRFNGVDQGRFFIMSITMHLYKANPQPPYYAGLQSYFDKHGITEITPTVMRNAVIDIRKAKLPDPKVIKNNGSFFGNPVIPASELAQLQADHGEIPHWPTSNPNRVKLSAAWLIDKAGFSNAHDAATGMGTYPTQSLVLINESAQTTAQLLAFRDQIITAVQTKVGVTLKQEPELLPKL